MRVLVYCPLNPTRPRIYAETIKSLFSLDWPEPYEIMFGANDQPEKDKLNDLMDKHKMARDIVLSNGYDAILIVEADMIVPPDTLKRLTAIGTDVAYGLYVSRHGDKHWLTYSDLGQSTGRPIDKSRLFCVQNWGKVIECAGVGMGCTFIHRRVLEKIDFRLDGGAADDWYFALDVKKAGFRQHSDLGVACGHITDKGILWPSIKTKNLVFFEAFDD